MKITDIYAELNAVIKGMTGTDDIAVTDTSSFVSLGNDILSSTDGVKNFGQALGDRIAKIITEVESYIARDRRLWTDNLTYGSALKIIHIKDTDNSRNTMYGDVDASQSIDQLHINPSELGRLAQFTTTVFSKSGVWAYSDLIMFRDQLEKAFINESEMSAFLDSQFTVIYNARELDKEATDNLAINTMIAQKVGNVANKPNQFVNLIKEYYDATGTNLDVDGFRKSADALRFASQLISTIAKQMKDKTVLYNNATGISANTPNDRLVIEVLTDFANDCKYNLESDTYNNDLVALVGNNYSEINYWQGYGETGSFAEKSFIGIDGASIGGTTGTDDVEQSGIVAVLRDERLVRSHYDKVYSDTYYNPATRGTTYFFRAEKGYLIDNAYNGVVFYLEEFTPVTE